MKVDRRRYIKLLGDRRGGPLYNNYEISMKTLYNNTDTPTQRHQLPKFYSQIIIE